MSSIGGPPASWKAELQAFFELRSEDVRGRKLTNEALCWVSGREPRLWSDPALYPDLIASLVEQLDLRWEHRLLEVGCAAGFLTRGLATCVGCYVGVDLSLTAVLVAKSLGLPSAAFVQADGVWLPFPDGVFDRVISYDVFTNIADWVTAERIVTEMVRVAKTGGKVMVGSLADEEMRPEFERVVRRVGEELDQKYGSLTTTIDEKPFWRRWLRGRGKRVTPKIVCYYFRRQDFVDLGRRLDVTPRIADIHQRNPYLGFRFNVVYTKPVHGNRQG